ncbi:hypothetical protein KR222_002624, partial [Zaprionus bogoriensis]
QEAAEAAADESQQQQEQAAEEQPVGHAMEDERGAVVEDEGEVGGGGGGGDGVGEGGAGEHHPSGSSGMGIATPELSERLRKVMLCTVCLDLPHPDNSYQCSLGHIVCEDCVTRLLAEAALNQRDAQCPHCRTHISWPELSKNLAVGQTLWELPKKCPDCEQQMEYKLLAQHLKQECGKRVVHCQYRCLGCQWRGCHEACAQHEGSCKHYHMSGEDILSALHNMDELDQLACLGMRQCHRALSCRRIFYEDLELHWPHNLSLLSNEVRFQLSPIDVFEERWRLRVRLLQGSGTDRQLSYCLKLVSMPAETMSIKYFATLPALYVQAKQLMDVEQQLNEIVFTSSGQSDIFKQLPMSCPIATYRLLAMPRIKLRLWMMLD